MTVYKNNRDKWCVDVEWVHADGRVQRVRKTSPIQTKRDAEKYERELRDSLSDGTYGKSAPDEAPTVAEFRVDFMQEYRGEKRKASGIRDKESLFDAHLVPLFGNKKVTSFGLADQRKLRDRFSEYKSNSRYNSAVAAINRLIELYHIENKLSGEPFKFALLPVVDQKRTFYTHAQYRALLEGAKKHSITAELMCLLGGDAGLRRSEKFALNVVHCDMVNRIVAIEEAEVVVKGERCRDKTKGMNLRYVDMTARLHLTLARYMKENPRAKRILLDAEGNPFTPESYRDLMEEIQVLAGLEVTGNDHILRHTFCSHLAMRGVPVLTIQKLAGHKKIETTLKYMHLAPGETRRAIDKLEEPAAAE